jgi:aldehyde dehydrogenase (NAD+)
MTISETVQQVRGAYESQVSKSYKFRETQLRALYDLLCREESALCKALYQDLKKPEAEAYFTEIQPVKNGICKLLSNLDEYMEPISVERGPAFLLDRLETRRVPLGVVLIISPWNYPIQLALNPLAGAIAGGNAAIIKPSEIAPHTAEILAKLIPKYLDSKFFKVVTGGIPESTRLLEQKFDLIFYTGSTNVGKIVMKAAAHQLTPVVLELGGKSPVIVDSNVDPDIAAKRIMWGKLINCGQTCIAPDYILVHKNIAKPFVEAIKKCINQLLTCEAIKSPHYGRIISKTHFSRLSKVLQDQKKIEGCKMVYGGNVKANELFIEPSVFLLKKECHDDPIMTGEIFGPLIPIIEVDDMDDGKFYILIYVSCFFYQNPKIRRSAISLCIYKKSKGI